RFVRVLRELGYRAQKRKAGSGILLVCGVLSSEKRPSDARYGTCLLLDNKSLLSSEMSVKPLTVLRASILTYGVLARYRVCRTPIRSRYW
ncbi:MAG TPA: hypothetical protein VI756_13785, partial [Blastocatellia bacterium]